MTAPVTVDVAGGTTGGAARFRTEFYNYLALSGRQDVKVIGHREHLDPSWLLRREMAGRSKARRVALNNVGFVAPGGERWTLLRNALHFLTEHEASRLEPSLVVTVSRQAAVVRLAARRSDVVVVPCSSMAERVAAVMPSLQRRIVVRPHPVSANSIPVASREPAVLCPILFESYKQMAEPLTDMLVAMDRYGDPSVRLRVTADREELPARVASHPRVESVGRLSHSELRGIWSRSSAIFFPTGIESFGYPLAEARVSGHPVIGLDTAQNREIAGPALCGFAVDDVDSLYRATTRALSMKVRPDPAPFDPCSYFCWLLGS
jgi:glycosyltransferase involved in cell wall biosynthesis